MNSSWQIQEAKNKFSEVIEKAISVGPQEITRHGKKTAVIISEKDYRLLRNRKGPLGDFLQQSPLRGMTFTRSKELSRKVSF